MNKELLTKMESEKKTLLTLDNAAYEDYLKIKDGEDKEAIKKAILKKNEYYAKFNEVVEDIKNYKIAYESKSADFKEVEKSLLKKYEVTLNKADDKHEVESKKKPNGNLKRVVASILAAAVVFTGGYHVAKYSNKNNPSTSVADVKDNEKKETEQEEKPFEVYGKFKSASDESQLKARAEWIYNNYVIQQGKNSDGANYFTVDMIMNDLRMINGQYKEDGSGYKTYADGDVARTGKDILEFSNQDTQTCYGNNVFYTPMAPFFEDGSIEQKACIELDNIMVKIVDAIHKSDKEAFRTYGVKFAEEVNQIFYALNLEGGHYSLNQMDAPSTYFLYDMMHGMYSEYIQPFGEQFGVDICYRACIDLNKNEWADKSLSELIYTIDNRKLDGTAIRSGNLEEYENSELSYAEDLFAQANNYFKNNYDLQIGSSRKLK